MGQKRAKMLNFEEAPEHETDRQDFRAEDFAGHPEAFRAWISGDWSRVEQATERDSGELEAM